VTNCELTDLSREKRIGEWEALCPVIDVGAPISSCLLCGWPVDMSKHYGSVWFFDRNTETIHVCKPTLNRIMARVRRDLENGR
jgi:hypothetical protein